MKNAILFFAAALLAVTPAAAQPHQETHPTTHSPVMHAPSTRTIHPVTRPRVATHHAITNRHPSMTTRHAVSHHRVAAHTRHVVRRVARHVATHVAKRTAFHRAPAAVVARLRKNVVAVHRFHAGPYRAPPGWRYRRWVFGERLPSIYFGRSFWITDFLAFGLFAPPDGLVWVRYGPDALLIDEYTGEIIQVDYGVFF
jgi:Ni/Co efflux regulator RcnB